MDQDCVTVRGEFVCRDVSVPLCISVWDADMITSDDLLQTYEIDLEDTGEHRLGDDKTFVVYTVEHVVLVEPRRFAKLALTEQKALAFAQSVVA